MTYLKRAALAFLFSLMIACGGTKNDELDYTQITDAEMMQMADTKMEAGNYEAAIADYNKLLLDFPTSNLHIDAQIKIAEAYGRLDKFEDQMNQLHRLVKENIIPSRVPRIYVQLGKFYERAAIFNPGIASTDTADYRDAINYYDQALKYPDSDDNRSKSEAVYRRALVEAKIGQIEEAIARYRLVSSLFPNSDFSILSQIKLKNPENTNELATTDSALTVYRETLGLAEVQEEEAVEEAEETPSENVEGQDESNLESIMEPTQEEPANEMEEGSPADEENEAVEEQPDTDDLFTPAVEDTSDNR